MRLLGRADDRELVEASVVIGHDAPPFQRAHHLARCPQFPDDRPRRLGFDCRERHVDVGGEEDVVAPRFVHERRAGLAGLQHIVDHRQRIKIDLNLCSDVLRLGAGRRDAHGDRLADMAHLIDRQHGLQR